ncbi:MAG TPA: NYN domain-containing protein, partial [Gemmata sp.]
MKPSAVLLIDFENFYHSRRDYFRDQNIPVGDQPGPADDLAALVRVAERMAELPLAVRRAYANFNSLPGAARDLMHRGIEPVQVFCLSETSNKNAADMKLAMDAVALADSSAPFEHFVLVTGDSDFIPVILELKRRGHSVSVVAVTGATSTLIRRFA